MIRDLNVIESCDKEWCSVRHSQAKLKINIDAASLQGAIFLPQVSDSIYALLLPFGFSVLEHVLQGMRDDKLFTCKRSNLEALMKCSKDAVSWHDYKAIDNGREVRNKLMHEQAIPLNAVTFRILDEIETELIGWRVLKGPVKYEFTLSVGNP